MKKFQQGFTLAEILIVVAIIALLSIVALMSIFGQMAHATDVKRKADLSTLSKFFEDYYNDKNGFPDASVVNDCGGTIVPYITNIPCDPTSKTPYGYFPSANGGYRICTKLTDTTDPAIAAAGCGGPKGCGLGGPSSGGVYNYCLASGVTASAVGTGDEISGAPTPTSTPTPGGGGGSPTSTPTPTPTPTPNLNPAYHVVCTSGGACVWFSVPADHGCHVSWESDCPGFIHSPETPFSGACGDSANRCTE